MTSTPQTDTEGCAAYYAVGRWVAEAETVERRRLIGVLHDVESSPTERIDALEELVRRHALTPMAGRAAFHFRDCSAPRLFVELAQELPGDAASARRLATAAAAEIRAAVWENGGPERDAAGDMCAVALVELDSRLETIWSREVMAEWVFDTTPAWKLLMKTVRSRARQRSTAWPLDEKRPAAVRCKPELQRIHRPPDDVARRRCRHASLPSDDPRPGVVADPHADPLLRLDTYEALADPSVYSDHRGRALGHLRECVTTWLVPELALRLPPDPNVVQRLGAATGAIMANSAWAGKQNPSGADAARAVVTMDAFLHMAWPPDLFEVWLSSTTSGWRSMTSTVIYEAQYGSPRWYPDAARPATLASHDDGSQDAPTKWASCFHYRIFEEPERARSRQLASRILHDREIASVIRFAALEKLTAERCYTDAWGRAAHHLERCLRWIVPPLARELPATPDVVERFATALDPVIGMSAWLVEDQDTRRSRGSSSARVLVALDEELTWIWSPELLRMWAEGTSQGWEQLMAACAAEGPHQRDRWDPATPRPIVDLVGGSPSDDA